MCIEEGLFASLLQKSGVKFEASLRKRERANPRFGFLALEHQYHAFYRCIPLHHSFAFPDHPLHK